MTGGRVAIVDYGVGNLFSVMQACRHVGLNPQITSNSDNILAADAVILPGVGAFGYAMKRLDSAGLTYSLRQVAEQGRPLMGVCLGFQLLFDSSEEMGHCKGLGLLRGTVRPLSTAVREQGFEGQVRLPNVAWLPISPSEPLGKQSPWQGTLLQGVAPGAEMYFVHSYFVDDVDAQFALAQAEFYGFKYCCAASYGNVFGCQFHPEKSAHNGIGIYRNLASKLAAT